jgi:hypothetical protein
MRASATGLSLGTGRGAALRRIAELESALARTSTTVDALNVRLGELDAAVEALRYARHVNLQLPFTQRTQAMKMVREGRPAKQIAAVLGLPQGEVLLLTRVQEIQMGPPLPPPSQRNERETPFAAALRQLTERAGDAA